MAFIRRELWCPRSASAAVSRILGQEAGIRASFTFQATPMLALLLHQKIMVLTRPTTKLVRTRTRL